MIVEACISITELAIYFLRLKWTSFTSKIYHNIHVGWSKLPWGSTQVTGILLSIIMFWCLIMFLMQFRHVKYHFFISNFHFSLKSPIILRILTNFSILANFSRLFWKIRGGFNRLKPAGYLAGRLKLETLPSVKGLRFSPSIHFYS